MGGAVGPFLVNHGYVILTECPAAPPKEYYRRTFAGIQEWEIDLLQHSGHRAKTRGFPSGPAGFCSYCDQEIFLYVGIFATAVPFVIREEELPW